MSYSNKVLESQKKSANHATATKIKQLMDKLRRKENEKSARRWIWELLQNAKDASFNNIPVKMQIREVSSNGQSHIVISHNGRPFTIENITFLIEQVSNKSPNKDTNGIPTTTGRFGTGFITTHLLSEIVEVEGILKESDLPYRKFKIKLDRSGRTLEKIIDSVTHSIDELKKVDSNPVCENFVKGNANTHFTYELTHHGQKVADIGVKDLKMSCPFTMAFLGKIESITIEKSDISFSLSDDVNELSEDIRIFTIIEEDFFEKKYHNVAICKNENIAIAIPISIIKGKINIEEIDNKTPKIFCDFPLVGTEDYPFPYIVNSPNFHPEEPRDNIYLEPPEWEKDPEVEENISIIENSVRLYYKILNYAVEYDWGNIHILAKSLNSNKRLDLKNNDWFNKKIIHSLRRRILTSKIITNSEGEKVSILDEELKPNLYFPKANDDTELKGIWNVSRNFQPKKIPSWKEVETWKEIIWNECEKITLFKISKWIEEQENINRLSKLIHGQTNVYEWLNQVLKLVYSSKDCSSIEAEHKIFPNQNGVFVKINSLYWEDEVTDETIKDILALLNNDVREILLDSAIFYQAPLNRTHDINFLSSELHRCVLKELRNIPIEAEKTKTAFKKLLVWFKGKDEFINDSFANLYQLRHRLLDDNEVIENIQKAEEIDELMEEFEVSDIHELRKILTAKKLSPETNSHLEPFTKEILASLGVTTTEELKEALRNKDLAQLFAHHSTPTVEMFQYAQSIIERAKLRVIAHLKTMPEYDVSNAELIATTIFAGITKEGKDINVVVRPCDNGEVILYYGSEKDALDFEISELWVENGDDTPKYISFGKLIKDTGINRFPIK